MGETIRRHGVLPQRFFADPPPTPASSEPADDGLTSADRDASDGEGITGLTGLDDRRSAPCAQPVTGIELRRARACARG